MTPVEFVEAVRKIHAPYLPEVVSVLCTDPCDPNYNQGEWHDPSVAERAASLELWCDGCRLPASRCQVAHLLALVDVS